MPALSAGGCTGDEGHAKPRSPRGYADLALYLGGSAGRAWLMATCLGLEPYWGKPDVRNLRGGAGDVTKGAGLRPTAKAVELPPDPTVGAPVLYPTAATRPNKSRSCFRSYIWHWHSCVKMALQVTIFTPKTGNYSGAGRSGKLALRRIVHGDAHKGLSDKEIELIRWYRTFPPVGPYCFLKCLTTPSTRTCKSKAKRSFCTPIMMNVSGH